MRGMIATHLLPLVISLVALKSRLVSKFGQLGTIQDFKCDHISLLGSVIKATVLLWDFATFS